MGIVDHVLVYGLMVLLDIDLHFGEQLLDLDEVAGVLPLLLLREHGLT